MRTALRRLLAVAVPVLMVPSLIGGWPTVATAAPGDPPVAAFTVNPSPASCGQTVTFNGSASYPRADRPIVSYSWNFGDGGFANGAVVTHSYSQLNTFWVYLAVTDGYGVSASTSAPVNVSNRAPTARHGGPYTVTEGNPVMLNGTGSTDPDVACGDAIVQYMWNVRSWMGNGPTPTIPAATIDSFPPGTHTLQLTVVDTRGASSTAFSQLTVSPPGNTPPVAVDDPPGTTWGTTEDVTLPALVSINVLANDSDAEGSTLTAVLVDQAEHGTVSLNDDGTFSYTPEADWNGTDHFTYRAHDGTDGSNVATVTLTVNPDPDAPVARDDGPYQVSKGGTLIVSAVDGVLANDTDADGETLRAYIQGGVGHGTVTLNEDGSFTYAPPSPTYVGTTTFPYSAQDPTFRNSNGATVTIDVVRTNHDPTPLDDTVAVDEDAIATGNVLTNDTDPDGDPMIARVDLWPNFGALTLDPDGSFTYEPDSDYHGPDAFSYTVTDEPEDGTATASVTITVSSVNDPPVGVPDLYLVDEGQHLLVDPPGLFENDSDVDGDTLSLGGGAYYSGPNNFLSLGNDGGFEFIFLPDWSGTDTFTYLLTDGHVTIEVPVTMVVRAVNDAPILGVGAPTLDPIDEDATTNSGTSISTLLSRGGPITDPDPAPLQGIAIVQGPPTSHGVLQYSTDGGATWTPVGSVSSTNALLLGSAASNKVRFVPDPNFSGWMSPLYSFRAWDQTSGTNGAKVDTSTNGGATAFSSTSDVALIRVNPVDDPASAVDDSYTTLEDTVLHVAAPGVLGNDSSVDGPLTASLPSPMPPTPGGVALTPSGQLTFTPATDYHGTFSFPYEVRDGIGPAVTATVSITVEPVNHAPIAVNDVYSTNEDVPLVVSDPADGVLGNDSDPDGDVMQMVLGSPPSHGTLTDAQDGTFVYAPVANWNGTDTFSYAADDWDMSSALATVTITVMPATDAPVVTTSTGAVPYTENAGETLVDPLITVTDDDDTYLESATVRISANYLGGNDLLGTSVGGIPGSWDPPSGTLTLSGHHTVADYQAVLRSVVFLSSADAWGALTREVTFTVDDGDGPSAPVVKSIAITEVNDPPVNIVPGAQVALEETPLVFSPPNGNTLSVTDLDAETADVRVSLTVDHGILRLIAWPVSVNVAGNGTADLTITGPISAIAALDPLIFEPPANWNGEATLTFVTNDQGHTSGPPLTDTDTVRIDVVAETDPPVAVDDAYSTDEDTTLTVTVPDGVLGNDTDADGDPLTAVLGTGPANGTLTLGVDGAFTYAPAADFAGTDSFTYEAHDGGMGSGLVTVTITVTEVNDAPVLSDVPDAAVDEGVQYLATFSVVHPDTHPVYYSLAGAPAGAVLDTAQERVTWTPTEAEGPETVVYSLCATDTLATDCHVITVNVAEVNLPPVLAPIGPRNGTVGTTLSFTATAADADLPAQAIAFSLVGAPAGASIGATSGVFAWTPSTAGAFTFDVCASDSVASGCDAVTVTIGGPSQQPNEPPVLAPIPPLSTDWAVPVDFVASGSDPEGQALRYSLLGAPVGASIDPVSGHFAWTPTAQQIGTHPFTVRVVDAGSPMGAAERSVQVTVSRRPAVLAPEYASDQVQFSDELECAAILVDGGAGSLHGTPIEGATIGFAMSGQAVSAVTEVDGLAETGMDVLRRAGTYRMELAFAGGARYEPAAAHEHVTVARELATIRLVTRDASPSDPLERLTVRVTEAPDGMPGGRLSSVRVRFAAFGNDAASGPVVCTARIAATSERSGMATCRLRLEPVRYRLRVRFLDNPYYVPERFTTWLGPGPARQGPM